MKFENKDSHVYHIILFPSVCSQEIDRTTSKSSMCCLLDDHPLIYPLEMTPSSKIWASTWSTIVRTKIRKSTWSRQEMILPREILREIRVHFDDGLDQVVPIWHTLEKPRLTDWLTFKGDIFWDATVYLVKIFSFGDTIIHWLLFVLSRIFIFPKVIRSNFHI